MKKLAALLLALCMALALCACSSGDSTPTPTAAPSEAGEPSAAPSAEASEPAQGGAAFTTVEEGKLTMSTNAAFPPYEMTTDSGDFEGIDVEIAAAIAEKLGLELDILDTDFDSALLAVNQGKSDMVMAGVSITDDRQWVDLV